MDLSLEKGGCSRQYAGMTTKTPRPLNYLAWPNPGFDPVSTLPIGGHLGQQQVDKG